MHAMCSETGRGVLPMVAEMPAMCSGTERGAPKAAGMHVTYSGTVLAALMAAAGSASAATWLLGFASSLFPQPGRMAMASRR